MSGMDATHWVVLIVFVAILVLFAFNLSVHKDTENKDTNKPESK